MDWGAFFAALFLVVIVLTVVGAFVSLNHANNDANHKINACLAAGGTPIVAGHQYTTEYKGCVMP